MTALIAILFLCGGLRALAGALRRSARPSSARDLYERRLRQGPDG